MSKSVSLYINTANNQETVIKIDGNGVKDEVIYKGKNPQAQTVLPGIEEILNKHNLQVGDVKQVKFYPGPGSYTGLRVGAAVANTLGWILGIGKPEYPKYE